MTNNLELEAREHLAHLESVCDGPRVKAVLDFAKRRGFAEGIIRAQDGSEHSAAKYACQLDFYSESIAGMTENETESFQILSILYALEAIQNNPWSTCSRLNYELSYEGIRLTRAETIAFFSQKGTWSTKEKGNQLEGNPLSVAMYCGQLFTLTGSLTGRQLLPTAEMPEDLAAQFQACWKPEGPQQSIEAMLLTFATVFVGKENESKIMDLINEMRSSDFYSAPASTKYHLSYFGGLSEHVCNVIARHVSLQKPQTAAELGEIVLTDTCHDLSKTYFYRPYSTRKKEYHPEINGQTDLPKGYFLDFDGRVYSWKDVIQFEVADQIPLPHSAKSIHMAVRILGKSLTPRMAEAIEAHMRDIDDNPCVDYLFIDNPLAMFLHMADVQASKLDEVMPNG